MKLHSIILNASAQLMILVFFLHILEWNESVSIGLVRDTVIKLNNYDDGQQKSSEIIMKKRAVSTTNHLDANKQNERNACRKKWEKSLQ